MDSGYYALSTALIARTQALDTIANNLANTSTAGYLAQRNVFGSLLSASSDAAASPLNRAINNYGVLGATTLDLTDGALQKTGNDLDVAILGPGFFQVKTARGLVYTRNGSFQVTDSGQLITAQGDAVMGDTGPITLPPGPVIISPDGTISSNGAVTGKLNLMEFPQGTSMTSMGGVYYTPPANVVAAPATSSKLEQGALEGSNVNPIAATVQLIEAERSDEMMQRALSMFNAEMDKTATQDLPKVG
ncbi:MAG: flagellar hook-basal body protein [Acidobacteriaceae bacterium]